MPQPLTGAVPAAASHSADVRMTLKIEDRVIRVGKLGPDRITLYEGVDLPPGPAVVVICVDGVEHHRPVMLPNGASASSRFVAIT